MRGAGSARTVLEGRMIAGLASPLRGEPLGSAEVQRFCDSGRFDQDLTLAHLVASMSPSCHRRSPGS